MQLATSYMSAAQFAAMPSDNSDILSTYTSPQIQSMLTAASGIANAIMRRNLLATERTEVFDGEGSNILSLGTRPVIYVRQMQFVQPGISGFVVPSNRVLIDGRKGEIVTYSPLELQGIGYVSIFPVGIGFSTTFAAGYGYNPVTPPSWTSQDAPGGALNGLTPGPYVLGVTTYTMWGETLASFQAVTTASGAIQLSLQQMLGAWKYRVFIAPGAITTVNETGGIAAGATSIPLTDAAALSISVGSQIMLDPANSGAIEVVTVTAITGNVLTTTPTQYAHADGIQVLPQTSLVGEIPATTFGATAVQGTIASLTPPTGYFSQSAPLTDTSGVPTPPEIQEAVRLLLLSRIYEQNNLANRGIYQQRSNAKMVSWKSTEGMSGKGVPTLWQQASEMLQPYVLSSFFGK